MPENVFLSIVIPAHNEEKRIGTILDAIFEYQKDKEFEIEVIVVNNASTDKTHEVVKSYSDKIPILRILERKSKGKGGAVHDGMLYASGQWILFADADNSTPIEQVDKLLKYQNVADMIIGSRYCRGGKLAVPQSFIRRLGSRVLNFSIQTVAVYGIKDTQCGFKLFSHKAAQEIFQRQLIFGFSFDIELLAIAKKLGYKIREVGITWYDNPHSTVNPLRDGARMLADAWQIRQNMLAGKYQK